jgi:hypothetical protein
MRYPTAKPIDQFPCILGESIYVVLEGFAGKAAAQAKGLQPRPLAANGKCQAAGKAPKPEDFEFG